MTQREYTVYILRCADDTLYTGITPELERRIECHNSGKGAKYTRSRRPVRLIASWRGFDYGEALRTEAAIKRLRRAQKERLIECSADRELLLRQLNREK